MQNIALFRNTMDNTAEGDHFDKVMKAIKTAYEWKVKPKPEKDRNEVIECPMCKGKLHMYQSAYNGHVHGKCETPNCLYWME